MSGDPLLRRLARATVARPDALARVRSRLHGGLPDDEELRAVLHVLPGADPLAAQRIRGRLRDRPPARGLSPLVLLVPAGLGGAMLLAAFVLFAVRFLAPPRPLALPLSSQAAWTDLAPTSAVRLAFRGAGELGGHERAPVVDWEVGTLQVEVEPDRGIALAVRTREAEVRVIGTGFDVTRDRLGTSVSVRHGRVAVRCGDRVETVLDAGQSRLCPPTGAAGLLGRARALLDAETDGADALASAEAGLAERPEGTLHGELVLVRVEALTRLGRHADALAAAEAALGDAPLRAADLRRLAARNALAATGCASALPHLAALVQDAADGPELVQYADCVAATDPSAARAALLAALGEGPPPDHAAAIHERLARLSPEVAP